MSTKETRADMNCYYCGKTITNTDPKPLPTNQPTEIRCADCDVDCRYVYERGQRPLLNLLAKVVRNPVEEPRPPLPESITTAIARMPEQFYLQCCVEPSEEEDHQFISAVIMERCPDDGWPSLDAYYGSPGHREDPRQLEQVRLTDACRVGVTADIDEPQEFEARIISMIADRWPKS